MEGVLFEFLNRVFIGLIVMIFTASILIPYLLLTIKHTQARLFTTVELRGFVDSYSSTPEWAISAITVPFLALTTGPTQSVYVDAAILSAFLFPAAIYLNRNFPFGFWVEASKRKISSGDTERYKIKLSVTAGSNIEQYALSIDPPTGVGISGFQGPNSKHELNEDKMLITGPAPIDRSEFSLSFIISETTGIGYDSAVEVSELDSDRKLASVELSS